MDPQRPVGPGVKLRTRIVNGRVIVGPAEVRPHPRGRGHAAVRQAVADRDGWICQLCGEPIDLALRRPHPFALAVDHVVGLAAGGSDEISNLRATHALCNSRRRA